MPAAVAYIRVSSQRQVEEGGSLDSQTKQVERYAELADYDLVRVFREEGESAKTDQRPRLQEMLAFCRERNNRVEVVIIPKIDRLARNVADYANLKIQLNRLGIRLESLGEHIEDTPVGRFTETVLASVAQFDNEVRAERCKGGMIEAVTQGRWVWQPPLGYRTIRHQGKGTIEPDPVTAPIVQEAFRLLAYGHQGVRAVLQYLRLSGVPRSKGHLYRMIANEIYIGSIAVFGGRYEAKPPFVALVDQETFYRAQAAIRPSNQPQQYQAESEDFPLRGTMRCSCGKLFTASRTRGEQGKHYPYYRCMHCNGRSYSREKVHALFLRELGAWRGHEEAWERLKQKLLAFDDVVQTQLRQERATAMARVDELRALRESVALKNAAGVIPDDVAKAQIDRLGTEIATLHADLPTPHSNSDPEALIDFARRFFENLKDVWQGLSLKTKKDLLRFLFPEGILFRPERGFRTPGSTLSERVKRAVSGSKSHVVDHSTEFSKDLLEWITRLSGIANSSGHSIMEYCDIQCAAGAPKAKSVPPTAQYEHRRANNT